MRRTLGGLKRGGGEKREGVETPSCWTTTGAKSTGAGTGATEVSGLGVGPSLGAMETLAQQSESAETSAVSGRQQPCSPARAAAMSAQGQKARRAASKVVLAVPTVIARTRRFISIP
jgi:hypothetical protein